MRAMTLILVLAAVMGCATKAADADGDMELRDRDWTLVSVSGFDSVPSGASAPTIRFGADGQLTGNTGCNSMGAGYTPAGDRLKIEMMMMTKRACVDPQGNALERAYSQALERTRGYRIADGQLELVDESGRVVARFR